MGGGFYARRVLYSLACPSDLLQIARLIRRKFRPLVTEGAHGLENQGDKQRQIDSAGNFVLLCGKRSIQITVPAQRNSERVSASLPIPAWAERGVFLSPILSNSNRSLPLACTHLFAYLDFSYLSILLYRRHR